MSLVHFTYFIFFNIFSFVKIYSYVCVGVWDVMTNLDVVDYLLTMVAEVPDSDADSSPLQSVELADHIVDISLKLGSTDNISALVVKFLANPPLRAGTSTHKGALIEGGAEHHSRENDDDDKVSSNHHSSRGWNKKVKVSHVRENEL